MTEDHLNVSLSLSHTHTHTHSLSLSLSFVLFLSLSHTLSISLGLSLLWFLTLSHELFLSHSQTQCLSLSPLTQPLSLSLSHSLSCPLTHSLSHSVAYTLTFSHTLSFFLTLSLSLTRSLSRAFSNSLFCSNLDQDFSRFLQLWKFLRSFISKSFDRQQSQSKRLQPDETLNNCLFSQLEEIKVALARGSIAHWLAYLLLDSPPSCNGFNSQRCQKNFRGKNLLIFPLLVRGMWTEVWKC